MPEYNCIKVYTTATKQFPLYCRSENLFLYESSAFDENKKQRFLNRKLHAHLLSKIKSLCLKPAFWVQVTWVKYT